MSALLDHIEKQRDLALGLEGLLDVLGSIRPDLAPHQTSKMIDAAFLLAKQIATGLDPCNFPKERPASTALPVSG